MMKVKSLASGFIIDCITMNEEVNYPIRKLLQTTGVDKINLEKLKGGSVCLFPDFHLTKPSS